MMMILMKMMMVQMNMMIQMMMVMENLWMKGMEEKYLLRRRPRQEQASREEPRKKLLRKSLKTRRSWSMGCSTISRWLYDNCDVILQGGARCTGKLFVSDHSWGHMGKDN